MKKFIVVIGLLLASIGIGGAPASAGVDPSQIVKIGTIGWQLWGVSGNYSAIRVRAYCSNSTVVNSPWLYGPGSTIAYCPIGTTTVGRIIVKV